MKNDFSIELGRTLAEILLLQRWAGGKSVQADRIFGLLHGIESVLREENCKGIGEELQRKIEDVLDDVDRGKQSPKGPAIKSRLHRDGIDDRDATTIMQLCRLQNRFPGAIDQIIDSRGSPFASMRGRRGDESQWLGALHIMELVDTTEGARQKMHAVFSACVPRVGEVIESLAGSHMRVVGVEHVIVDVPDSAAHSQRVLIPHVILEAIEEE